MVLSIFLTGVIFPVILATPAMGQTQDSDVALQRGYRTGYSDGFMAGYKDVIDAAAKDYSRHADYTKADRAYSKDYGLVEDYRDGYQQGFESGYDKGFEKRAFDANLPTNLIKRGAPVNQTQTAVTGTDSSESTSASDSPASYQTNGNAIIVIPRDTDVDQLNRQLHRELSSYMVERPTTISRCLHLMVISKSLERIADHATNIAEEVVYLYEAKDIRHTGQKTA